METSSGHKNPCHPPSHRPTANDSPLQLLTIDDVAAMLKSSRQTIYGWASRRKIPFLKVGGALRFRESEISAWLTGQDKPSPAPARKLRANRLSGPQGEIDRMVSRARAEVLGQKAGRR